MTNFLKVAYSVTLAGLILQAISAIAMVLGAPLALVIFSGGIALLGAILIGCDLLFSVWRG